MIIGFTGTQKGMTPKQEMALSAYLDKLRFEGNFLTLCHGDCIGADAEAHDIAFRKDIPIVVYPPDKDDKRAYCKGGVVKRKKPAPYLDRNRAIVKVSDVLVAAPKSRIEEKRSGTWFTVRYARLMEKPIVILFP